MTILRGILAAALVMGAAPALAATKAPAKPAPAKHAAPAKAPAKSAAKAKPAPRPATDLAYIGTFTNETGSPRSENHGQGLYAVELDKDGKLVNLRLAAKTPSPSWLTIDQKRAILYAANEYNGFGEDRTGSISAFAIDRTTGVLDPINTASAFGAPTYVTRDPSGRFLLTANWTEGSITVLRIRPDGGVGEMTDQIKPTGPRNAESAADNPPGQLAASSHAHSRPHMIGFDPSGRYVIVNDAGLDQILVFKLDPATGRLTPNDPPAFAEKPGVAPRHFAFGPDGRAFYDLMEQNSRLGVYAFDPDKGSFTLRQKLSALPDGFQGSSLASELLIAKDGKYLYAANRTHDTITTFAVGKDGLVKRAGETHTQNDGPRSLAFSPDEKFIFSLNQRGDDVTVFHIDAKSREPVFTGQFLAVGSPGAMTFVEKAANNPDK